jgi:putative membrane protein
MNRRITLCVTAASALLAVAACQRQNADTTTAAAPADAVNAPQDATSAATSAATVGAATAGGYVTNAAIGDMYEIQAGQMAQERGQAAGVKAFGRMLASDHTATSNEMKTLASAAGQTPPAALDQRHQGMIDNLRAANGTAFDNAFLTQQIAAHEEAITLHRGYSESGDNAALKEFAVKTVPKLEQHLQEARRLQGDQAGGTKTGQ